MTRQREECPYVGLRPFESTDAPWFAGRSAAIHELLGDWLAHRLVVLHGPRGVGKSSLLLGGVVPYIRATEADLLPIVRFPADVGAPAGEDAPGYLNPFLARVRSAWFPEIRQGSDLDGFSLAELVRRRSLAATPDPSRTGIAAQAAQAVQPTQPAQPAQAGSRPVLMAIDQFEGVLTVTSPELRAHSEAFLEDLGALVATLPNLHLLVSVREDDRTRLAPHEEALGGGAAAVRVRVAPLDRSAAAAALREPLRTAGIALSGEAAASLVEDLCTCTVRDGGGDRSTIVAETVEPAFVQLVGTALWTSVRGGPDTGLAVPPDAVPPDAVPADAVPADIGRPERPAGPDLLPLARTPRSPDAGAADPPLVVTAGQVDGLVETALGRHVTRTVLDLAQVHGRSDTELRDWLVATFVTERGRRRFADEGLRHTNGLPNALVHAFVDRYVLTSEWRADSRWFALSHDRLLAVVQAHGSPLGLLAGGGPAGAAELLGAARARLRDGDPGLAAAHAEEAVRRAGGGSRIRADAELFWGESLQQAGQLDNAELHYREAAALYESLPDPRGAGRVLTVIGRLLLRRGLHGRAVEELEAAASRLPGDAEVQADLARALWYSGQPWAAAAVFSTVLMIDPRSPNALADRGQLRLELGDDSSALADLEGSARLAPDLGATPELRAARGLAMARLGHLTEGSTETDAALEIAPDNGTVLLWAAGVARAAGDGGEADDMLRRSLRARSPALLPHQMIEAMRQLRKPGAMA